MQSGQSCRLSSNLPLVSVASSFAAAGVTGVAPGTDQGMPGVMSRCACKLLRKFTCTQGAYIPDAA